MDIIFFLVFCGDLGSMERIDVVPTSAAILYNRAKVRVLYGGLTVSIQKEREYMVLGTVPCLSTALTCQYWCSRTTRSQPCAMGGGPTDWKRETIGTPLLSNIPAMSTPVLLSIHNLPARQPPPCCVQVDGDGAALWKITKELLGGMGVETEHLSEKHAQEM